MDCLAIGKPQWDVFSGAAITPAAELCVWDGYKLQKNACKLSAGTDVGLVGGW